MDLLKYNKEIDKRIMGSMRADHVQENTKKVFYGGRDDKTTSL